MLKNKIYVAFFSSMKKNAQISVNLSLKSFLKGSFEISYFFSQNIDPTKFSTKNPVLENKNFVLYPYYPVSSCDFLKRFFPVFYKVLCGTL